MTFCIKPYKIYADNSNQNIRKIYNNDSSKLRFGNNESSQQNDTGNNKKSILGLGKVPTMLIAIGGVTGGIVYPVAKITSDIAIEQEAKELNVSMPVYIEDSLKHLEKAKKELIKSTPDEELPSHALIDTLNSLNEQISRKRTHLNNVQKAEENYRTAKKTLEKLEKSLSKRKNVLENLKFDVERGRSNYNMNNLKSTITYLEQKIPAEEESVEQARKNYETALSVWQSYSLQENEE